MKTNKPLKSAPQTSSRQQQRVPPAKPVAQLKPAETVKRPVAPPVYKPQPRQNSAQLKTATPTLAAVSAQGARRPVAPPVYKPQPRQNSAQLKKATPAQPGIRATSRIAQPKMAAATVNRKPPTAPPAYRPQQTPRVLQPKSAPGSSPLGRKAPVAPLGHSHVIQRMDQIPGLPGFFEGELPQQNRGGTFNTVWSQTEPMDDESSIMSHSSVKFTKRAKTHLVDFAMMVHLANEENTHAEDRLYAYCHQLAIQFSIEDGQLPEEIELPEFFVSASPCSSLFGTSGKSTGCTENLISWATIGMPIKSEMGCTSHVKITIGRLIVNKLYKSNSYEGASSSMAALIHLKRKGAIGGWVIEQDPPRLDLNRIENYQKKG